MSLPIWTPAALASEFRSYEGLCWRVVEAQHQVSTLKLVDTLDEQAVLEELIEATKPPAPPECHGLHYLLSTPFRYGAAYPHGSRFRQSGRTLGVYYAAEAPETAIAETAFHRLLFFAESPDTPWPDNPGEFTALAVAVASSRALDLTIPLLDRDAAAWTDLTDYRPCQALAQTTRDAGGEIIRYRSVRDPQGGTNLAVLTCAAFAEQQPGKWQSWHVRLSASGVQALCEAPRARLEFPRGAFAADPRIAGLRWER